MGWEEKTVECSVEPMVVRKKFGAVKVGLAMLWK